MQEHRCHNCKRLLYKADGKIEAEVICPGCRIINYLGRDTSDIGLRGKAFQERSVNHNCPKCNRLLLRSIGDGKIEVICGRCGGDPLVFDTVKMRTTGETSVRLDKELAK